MPNKRFNPTYAAGGFGWWLARCSRGISGLTWALGGNRMASPLSKNELCELSWAFAFLTDDSMAPIDPLTYRTYENDNCLHIAALRGNLRAVELLVKAGLDVGAPGDCGCTPLHYAYYADHGNGGKVAAFLLAHGARQDIEDDFGKLAKWLDERVGY